MLVRVVKVHAAHVRTGHPEFIGKDRLGADVSEYVVAARARAHVQAVGVEVRGVEHAHLVRAPVAIV